jgi:hypothetical protein
LKGTNRTIAVSVSNSDPRVEDYAWLRDGRMLYSENTLARIAGSRHPEIGLDNRSGVTIGEAKQIKRCAACNIAGLSAIADGSHHNGPG